MGMRALTTDEQVFDIGGRVVSKETGSRALPKDEPVFDVSGNPVDEKSFFDDRAVQAIPFELAGGLAAQAIPLPIPPTFKAALGEAGGRLAFEIGQPLVGEEIRPLGDIAKSTATTFSSALAGDFIGGKILKGIAKIKAPLKEGAEQAIKTAQKFTPKDVTPFTPSQLTEGFKLDTIEGAINNAFLGGRLREFKDVVQPKILRSVQDDFVSSIGSGASPREAGIIFQDIASKNKSTWNTAAQRLYDSVDEILGGTIEKVPIMENVPTGVLDASGKMIFDEVQTGVKKEIVGGARVNFSGVKDFVEDVLIKRGEKLQKVAPGTPGTSILNQMLGAADEVPFSNAQFLRSQLLRVAREEGISAPISKKLAGMIDGTIDVAAKKLDGEALSAFKRANSFWRGGSKRFNSELGKKLSQAHPSEVTQFIFTGTGTSDKIANARKIIGEDGWKEIQSSFLKQVFDGSLLPGAFLGEGSVKFTGLSSKLRRFGEDAMKSTFSKQQTDGIKNVLRIADFMQKKVPTPGGMAMTLSQVGAGTALIAFDRPGTGAAIIIGPLVLAKLLTNPKTALAIARGMQVTSKKQAGFRLSGRIIADAVRIAASDPDNEDVTDLTRSEAEGIISQGPVKTFIDPIPQTFNPEATISQGR